MIVCHCEEVHEKTIKHAIADGATNIEDLTVTCGAGGNCQGCWPALQELLAHKERVPHVPRWRRRVALPA